MSLRGRGGIGRHDGLKIRCLVIVREGSSPSVPIINFFGFDLSFDVVLCKNYLVFHILLNLKL